MSKKVALITGITGQDGSYLTELLLRKGYEVHGLVRHSSISHNRRIDFLMKDIDEGEQTLKLHYGDVSDPSDINKLISKAAPDEIYNLAAQSHVQVSFDSPVYTSQTIGNGTLNILEAIRNIGLADYTKFFQASSAGIFGNTVQQPQSELTPLNPCSPHGISKLYAHTFTKHYRDAHNIFTCNGILFNHESPRRGSNFVTKKITEGVARIALEKQHFISLGNLDAQRDWGYAKDYVEAMWMIMQHKTADDYVVATGVTHSVRDFVKCAFEFIGVEIVWEGEGMYEVGLDAESREIRIRIEPDLIRPADIDMLRGDPRKIDMQLGWKAQVEFEELVSLMVETDLTMVQNEIKYVPQD